VCLKLMPNMRELRAKTRLTPRPSSLTGRLAAATECLICLNRLFAECSLATESRRSLKRREKARGHSAKDVRPWVR